MRITGPNGATAAKAPAAARRPAAGGFSLSEPATSRGAAPATTLRTVSTVDALLALQGVETPTERKKRAVTKGRKALDLLDALKIGLLDGAVDGAMLARLKVASEGLADESGDRGLDEILGEIDLRVAVELAKAGVR
jgi:hypothetical protein